MVRACRALVVLAALVACGSDGRRHPSESTTACIDGYAAGGGWFADLDGDGYGDPAWGYVESQEGTVQDCGDCDDHDPEVHPGAADGCNGTDDDCDGELDEVPDAQWHRDLDGDGYGNPTAVVLSCVCPEGYVADGTDCHDGEADVHPGAPETCNGVDDDCDGLLDDADPDAGIWYLDADWDGYGDAAESVQACEAPPGYVADGTDCDDSDPSLGPWAVLYVDGDGDGLGQAGEGWPGCAGVPGTAPNDDDCDDTNPSYLEYASLYLDRDGDGYGADGVPTTGCLGWEGYAPNHDDCDDTDAAYHEEVSAFPDGDGDGYGSGARKDVCAGQPGWADAGGDCDDLDPAVNPGATEVCGDSIDNDCISGTGGCGFADDGDGMDDIAVGAPLNDRAGIDSGQVYVALGPVTAFAGLGAAEVVLMGASGIAEFGTSIASGCDVNEDGYADLVASGPEGGNDTVYVFAGPDLASFSVGAPWAWIEGDTGSRFGAAVACVPATASTRSGILVGAPTHTSSGSERGRAFLLRALDAGTW